MGLRISGKNIDIGDAFRGHVEARIGDAIEKYFDGGFEGQVTVEREGSGFHSDCTVHLDTGIVLRAEGTGQDAHQSFDLAAERIEKRLRRYKRRLKEHHGAPRGEVEPAASYVIAAPDEDAEVGTEESPVVIAEESTSLTTMSVGHAVMAMDLADVPVVVFRHAVHGGINVVYRRSDGNIGWIDPSRAAKPGPAGR
jgi:ribosome hibernation promoting factor